MGVRVDARLFAFEQCERCGHYVQVHDEQGCHADTFEGEEEAPHRCLCRRPRSSLLQRRSYPAALGEGEVPAG
jgi:hypothetical protein